MRPVSALKELSTRQAEASQQCWLLDHTAPGPSWPCAPLEGERQSPDRQNTLSGLPATLPLNTHYLLGLRKHVPRGRSVGADALCSLSRGPCTCRGRGGPEPGRRLVPVAGRLLCSRSRAHAAAGISSPAAWLSALALASALKHFSPKGGPPGPRPGNEAVNLPPPLVSVFRTRLAFIPDDLCRFTRHCFVAAPGRPQSLVAL